ncbi:MAG: bifunctional phosphoglucose/phosphomannose isomerase [Candidatus Heimdallarchaeaceae archaeon]
MINLDDKNVVEKIDAANQLQILSQWSSLFKEARERSLQLKLPKKYTWKEKEVSYTVPKTIVICGMGGSAISGDYLYHLLKEDLSVPIIVNREYNLPAFVSKTTLVICVSYSGNTEETISCFKDALQKSAMLCAVSSAGLIEKLSNKIGIPHIKIREGIPPRSGLPLIYTALLTILEKLELIDSMDSDIKETSEILEKLSKEYSIDQKTESNLPKNMAYGLYNTIPVFVGHTFLSPIAYRAKCELNENSKLLAISEEIPEQNHNGIVAWDNPNTALNDIAVVLFRDKKESDSIKVRVDEFKKQVEKKTEKVLEIYPEGKSKLAKQMSSTYLIDLTSIYLGILYEIDPSITPSIDGLKDVLRKKTNLTEKIEKELI